MQNVIFFNYSRIISYIYSFAKVWICEFCNTSNTVDVTSDEVPKKDDVTFMLQPSETSAATTGVDKKTISGDAGSLVIFCVDVSGSMSTDSRVSVNRFVGYSMMCCNLFTDSTVHVCVNVRQLIIL